MKTSYNSIAKKPQSHNVDIPYTCGLNELVLNETK